MDEETDDLLIALQSNFEGSNLAILSVMLALIDAGLISKNRLLDIIDSLHSILAADYVGKIGQIEDAEISLDSARAWLAGSDWRAGEVLEQLHKIENTEFLQSQIRSANSGKPYKRDS